MSENTISKSQAKRKARQEEIKRNKFLATRDKVIATVVVTALAAVVLIAVGLFIYNRMIQTISSDDFSAFLNEDGTVQNVDPLDHITPVDYRNFVVDQASVTFSDEAVETEISSLLSSHQTLSDDAFLSVADGNTVNIDYVGTVDGVAFEGGDTQGNGADLTIGSGQYVDDFEQQLIGSHPGDQVTVNVTFPDDYSNADLQGKDAVFEVTVNGIYVTPDFDDAFVAEHYADTASTAEEYKAQLKADREKENLILAIQTLIDEQATATSYNEEYLDYLRGILKFQDEASFQSINNMYYSMTGSYYASTFEDYTGQSIAEYEAQLTERCQTQSAIDLTYQYIFMDAGLTISEEDYASKVTELSADGVDSEEYYGKPFIMQMLISDKVIEYLSETVTIQ